MNTSIFKTLKFRLMVLPLSLIIISIGYLLLSVYVTSNYKNLLTSVISDKMQSVTQLTEYSKELTRIHAKFYSKTPPQSKPPHELELDKIQTIIDNLTASITKHSTLLINPNRSNIHNNTLIKLTHYLTDYLSSVTSYIEYARSTSTPEVYKFQATALNYNKTHQLMAELINTITSELTIKSTEELKVIDELTNTIFYFSITISLLFIIIIFLNVGKFSNQIKKIQATLLQLANNNSDITMPKAIKHHELKMMVDALKSYQQTQVTLNKTFEELSEIKSDLESNVEQRTRQLKVSNESLQQEILNHKAAKDNLKLSYEIIKSTSEAILVSDENDIIIDMNDAFTLISGYSRQDVLGKFRKDINFIHEEEQVPQSIISALEENLTATMEARFNHKDGHQFPIKLIVNRVTNSQNKITHFVAVFHDISEQQSKEKKLTQLANFDSLTQLPNRVLCRDRVEQKIKRSKRNNTKVALFFIDLDNFKHINDSLGHLAGDKLLIEISHRLKSLLREDDILSRINISDKQATVARLGGDEFLIAIGDLHTINSLTKLVKRIQTTIHAPIIIDEKEMIVNSSIGIAIYPDDSHSYDELTRNADTAMYRAKEESKGQFMFFTEDMSLQAQKRLTLEIEMRHSINQKDFELYFQPKINVSNKQTSGVEALVRWNHPELGFTSPLDFIPVAEESGLIIPLGEWILENACQHCITWNKSSATAIPVAVNVSPQQFLSNEFVNTVIAILKRTQLPAHLLELEITENVIINDIETTISIIQQLKALGVHVALDDFGTGYSSLSYLKKMPIDTLKIDRSFIEPLGSKNSNNDKAIIETIISLGHQMNMLVVAEGVETLQHVELLAEMNCDILQGYYYSKPLPHDKIIAFIEATNKEANQALN